MVEILGTNIPTPDFSVNIGGALSNSWIYILIVVIIGVILITTISLLLFFRTYNRKVIVFENIAGQGYQPVLKTKARIVKFGNTGGELLKTFVGGFYVSANSRRMGKRTYWFAKGPDGYLYNIILGELDTKKGILDIDPVDRDVQAFYVNIDRASHQAYGKTSWLEKHSVHLMLFVFLIVMLVGFWILFGKMGESMELLNVGLSKLADALKSAPASSGIVSVG